MDSVAHRPMPAMATSHVHVRAHDAPKNARGTNDFRCALLPLVAYKRGTELLQSRPPSSRKAPAGFSFQGSKSKVDVIHDAALRVEAAVAQRFTRSCFLRCSSWASLCRRPAESIRA